jgi:diguanylate cyclase (GGDEF)-like protein/PAS domain S-box-containing protein
VSNDALRAMSDGNAAPVLDRLPLGVIVADSTASASFANRAWMEMTGQRHGEWRGHGWLNVLDIGSHDAVRMTLVAPSLSPVAQEADLVLQTLEGRRRVLHMSVVSNRGVGGADGLIVTIADVTAERARADDLLRQATHDPLTGLYNRSQYIEFLSHALDRQLRESVGPAAVLFADIDGLKAVNDQMGHEAGDRVLQATATRLSGVVRPADVVARYGGDEFTVLCEDLRSTAEATLIARRIHHTARVCTSADGPVGLSVGLAIADGSELDPLRIIDLADQAMYQAKHLRAAARA